MYALDRTTPYPRTEIKLKSHHEYQVNGSNICNKKLVLRKQKNTE